MFEKITRKLTKIMRGMESYGDGDRCTTEYYNMDDKISVFMTEIGAKYIAQGSSRQTYKLNDNYVIKLALSDIGVAQNLAEVEYFKIKNSVFNKNVASSKKGYWIIAEYAEPVTNKKIKELFGCTKGQLDSMISHTIAKHEFKNNAVKKLYETKYRHRKFFKDLAKIPTLGILPDDLSSFYSENYGITKKGLVIVDGGLNKEIAQFYY